MKYCIYIDEVGNPDLESADNPNHRYLSDQRSGSQYSRMEPRFPGNPGYAAIGKLNDR